MPSPNLITTALLLVSFCAQAPATQADISATVRLGTGEFRFTNNGGSDVTLVAYSITQPAPDLLVTQWLHVAELRDSAGDGSVDNTGTWIILEPEEVMGELPALSAELIEGTVTGNGAVLAPGEYLYLGSIWDNASLRNIEALVAEEGSPSGPVSVSYVPSGDYNEDGLVDGADYELWKQSFGATGLGLLADGNADQQVNLADYTVWRNNLGATSLPPQAIVLAALGATTIPEPGTALMSLGLAVLLTCLLWRKRG